MHFCNHCCSGKAINIKHSEYVFVALVIQHAMHMNHNGIYGLLGSKIFFHITLQMARFSGRKLSNVKSVFQFSLPLLSETFLIPRQTE
jgi:hypothetical protein